MVAALFATTLLIFARSPPRKPRSKRVQRYFKTPLAASDNALPPALAAVINNLLSSYPSVTAGEPLPSLFTEQRDLLLAQYRHAKSPGVPLLVIGPPNIGKTTALINWIQEEIKSRPTIYMDLRYGLNSQAMPAEQTADRVIANDATRFRRCVEQALGFTDEVHQLAVAASSRPNLRLSSFVPARTSRFSSARSPDASQAFRHIVQALRIIQERNRGRPSLLVIDDAQLLLADGALNDNTEQAIEFLGVCEEEGLLEVVICGNEQAVQTVLWQVPGFDNLATLHVISTS